MAEAYVWRARKLLAQALLRSYRTSSQSHSKVRKVQKRFLRRTKRASTAPARMRFSQRRDPLFGVRKFLQDQENFLVPPLAQPIGIGVLLRKFFSLRKGNVLIAHELLLVISPGRNSA